MELIEGGKPERKVTVMTPEGVVAMYKTLQEKHAELEKRFGQLVSQLKDMQEHPFMVRRPDGRVVGHNCSGCAMFEVELNTALKALAEAHKKAAPFLRNRKS